MRGNINIRNLEVNTVLISLNVGLHFPGIKFLSHPPVCRHAQSGR